MPEPDLPAVVAAALPEELAPIVRHFGYVVAERIEGRQVFHTDVCSPRLVFAATGDGPQNAARMARTLCETFRPTAFVGVGIAGALTPALRPYELVASARLRNGAGAIAAADGVLLSVATAVGARPVTLITTMAPVVRVSEKKALLARFPEPGPVAVDMESASWADAAASAGVPFVAIRAITDGPEEELPHYLPECLGVDGGIQRTAVLRSALARPSSIPDLIALRRRVAVCSRKLAFFLSDFFVC
jgi:adenosylhomocysteine nucleosidase